MVGVVQGSLAVKGCAMGMRMYHWAGPVAVCSGVLDDDYWGFIETYEDRLFNARGELSEAGEIYLAPNRGSPRKFMLDDGPAGVAFTPDIDGEVDWFKSEYYEEIKALMAICQSVEVKWVIVAGAH